MEERSKYLSRKEFLELCGITKNTLVWYEKMGLIRPAAVGENGYHYYSREQFFEIDLIKNLKWADKSLIDCKDYIDRRSPEKYLELLLEQQQILEQKIVDMNKQKDIIDQSLRDFLRMQARYTEEPKLIEHPELYILVKKIKEKTPRGYIIALSELFEIFHSVLENYDSSSSMHNSALIDREDILAGSYQTMSYACLKIKRYVAHPACQRIPAGRFAVCFHTGPVELIGRTYDKMLCFIEKQGFEIAGDALENDYINYLSEREPERFSKEILIPVRKRE